MRQAIEALKAAFRGFINDECMVSGAALAYYTIFSLPPLLVLVFYLAGLAGVSQEKINEVIRKQVGVPVTQPMQASPTSDKGSNGQPEKKGDKSVTGKKDDQKQSYSAMIPGTVTKIAGIAILLFTATGVFAQLQHSLNQAWQVEPNPDASSWKSFLIKRILSLGMIIVIAFLLLVSLALTIIVEELVVMLRGQEAGLFAIIFGHIVNTIIALLMATLLFAALYKVLPDAELQWRDLWIGAFITALLFVLGKTLLGWYLSNSNIGASWGSAAASIIVVLVWVYYTSLIVLFGAELTQAWVSRTGSGIRPSPGAVHVYKQKVRGQQ